MQNITRQKFLQRTALAGAAVLLSSLETWAATTDEKKIKSGGNRLRQRKQPLPAAITFI